MVIRKQDEDIQGTSVDYRPDIRLLDCTVRDGSLTNNARFDDEFVRGVYEACVASGVDYMEIGYKASDRIFSRKEYGPWRFSAEEDIRRIVGDNPSDLKISVMADTGRTDAADLAPRSESVVDMIRVACYIHQIPAALELVQDAHEKGYETTLNLMAVSIVPDREIEEGLEAIMRSSVDVLYLVDSFGSLYFQPIRDLALTYITAARAAGKQVGIHGHNNMQLAFANTIEALVIGASYADGTFGGLGRGAGNCPTELLLAFLHNPKFRVRPALRFIGRQIEPLKQTCKWGYQLPYMITGHMNEHPRDAIAWLAGDRPDDFEAFWDKMTE